MKRMILLSFILSICSNCSNARHPLYISRGGGSGSLSDLSINGNTTYMQAEDGKNCVDLNGLVAAVKSIRTGNSKSASPVLVRFYTKNFVVLDAATNKPIDSLAVQAHYLEDVHNKLEYYEATSDNIDHDDGIKNYFLFAKQTDCDTAQLLTNPENPQVLKSFIVKETTTPTSVIAKNVPTQPASPLSVKKLTPAQQKALNNNATQQRIANSLHQASLKKGSITLSADDGTQEEWTYSFDTNVIRLEITAPSRLDLCKKTYNVVLKKQYELTWSRKTSTYFAIAPDLAKTLDAIPALSGLLRPVTKNGVVAKGFLSLAFDSTKFASLQSQLSTAAPIACETP